MNSMMKGEETNDKAYLSLMRCFYNLVLRVYSFDIDFNA